MQTILAILVVLAISLPGATGRAGTIYYYEGPDGVLHFTDLPLTPHYSPFVFWGDATGETKERIQKLITKYASQYGVDEDLVQALAHVESRYDCKAVSRAGAQGVMQIMPETQKDLGLTTPFDPAANVEAGVRYFKRMLDRFKDTRLALAAYNAGPGQVDKYKGVPPFPETEKYIQDVLNMYAKLKPRAK
ncbi:lytic transglycosylase domain-containing protein [Desulfoplanes sp. PS50]|jgi:soluble lytic murein transglycosylase-like protein